MILQYQEAKKLLKQGDILLFQGDSFVSWLIKTYSYGDYSHVGLVDLSNEIQMFCEMREFKGGRCVSLESQIRKIGSEIKKIDVFRLVSEIKYDQTLDDGTIIEVHKVATESTKDSMVNSMLTMTGSDYGWRNIWKIVKHYLPFFRLLKPKTKDDTLSDLHICSSAVSYCIRTAFQDPVPFLPDHMVTPSDLSRSPLIKYQFTIGKE